MRSQPGKYESGIHYSAPVEARECGRFNPPGGQIAVLYAADASITAMAEVYGRTCQLEGSVIYPESVLDQHYLCAVETLMTVKVIDIIGLLQCMHIPFSDLEGEDYRLPQWLMARLYGVSLDIEHYCTLRFFFDLCTLAGLSRRKFPEAGIRLLFQI
ncbi:RES domain-containing protein [Chimaeribacter arupi]|uniref:RES domain-containing protein n=1 Tax=Chimaeribacter arupi TaxID=2060066 RepID=UPI0011AF498E